MSQIDHLLTNLTELHTHLGGATSAHVLWELAHEQGINLKQKDYWKFIESSIATKPTDYTSYLNFYDVAEKIQSSPLAVEKSVHSIISSMYRNDKITQVEIRFNPMLRNRGGEHDLDKIVFAAIIGMKKVCIDYPVKAGLILMMDRKFDLKQNAIIVDKAIKYARDGIVAIDIAGHIKNGFAMSDLRPLVNKARDAGLKITIHTGEVTTVEEMDEVVEHLEPHRIGHGIVAHKSPELMKKLATKNIVLETCPTSNIKTSVVASYAAFKEIYQNFDDFGVKYTVNTDGASLIQSSLPQEFIHLFEAGALNEEQIARAIQTAHDFTFLN